ncbi:hypothetical protein GQ55_2G352800 [Panicum hallii var. hallii]|uniref:Uncharacterized protein n=1 Tax=Panicum hallii var. hallii TaxID=1504633 RepID=A0A2T7EVU1_9POAL|nr:hypothetical protein GQ55_2G352800 [Panicum hallii var. hallii]
MEEPQLLHCARSALGFVAKRVGASQGATRKNLMRVDGGHGISDHVGVLLLMVAAQRGLFHVVAGDIRDLTADHEALVTVKLESRRPGGPNQIRCAPSTPQSTTPGSGDEMPAALLKIQRGFPTNFRIYLS